MDEKTNDLNLVRIDRTGEIAVVTLDKPPVNALFIDLFDGITRASPRSLDRSPWPAST